MVKVGIWGSLRPYTDGQETVTIEATNLRELVQNLATAYPGMVAILDRGVSVSIDGRLYTQNWFQPIAPDSEVFVLPKIVGG